MIWWFYNIVFAAVFLLMLPRFLWRMWRRGGYLPSFIQRFGIYDKGVREKLAAMPERFLIHAVSVGEIQVALRFMAELRARRPQTAFVLTTTTSTAHRIAENTIGRDDLLLYFPADFPGIVRRALRQINPRGLILVESELWPNLVRQAAQRQIPVMLLNGRISSRSFRRYRLVRPLVKKVLEHFALFCAQSSEDMARLIELGAEPQRVHATGSAKYDIAGEPCAAGEHFIEKLQLLGFNKQNQLLVGGSTWPGEEKALLEIYVRLRGQYPHLRLILAPRHAERRKQVMAEIARNALDFKLWSECCGQGAAQAVADVLLVDTTGELRSFYAVADIVFIGKSLTASGGQNPIEAAVCARPIIIGAHTENFSGIVADFLDAQALIQVDDKTALEKAIEKLLADETGRRLLGERARRVVLGKSGALRVSAALFMNCLERSGWHAI